jgi:Aspartyl/Asparaginyl beta-hydroxylase
VLLVQQAAFDWNASYVLPAGLRFRATPAGALQVDGGGAEVSVEVPGEWVPLLLGFGRPRPAEAVFEDACRRGPLDREGAARALAAWTAQGLLRAARSGPPALTRLTLFARAVAELLAEPSGRFGLRSPFELQQPLLFYPGLETREVHDHRRLPWVAGLERAFPAIQREFHELMEAGGAFAAVHRERTSRGEWAAAYLWAFGEKVEDTCSRCPETARVLAAIPGVAQFGTTLFSALAPRSQIAPHHGYTNAKLRCQLPLRVPGGCKLKVGDQEIAQEEGRCIVFDDSFLHSAWNDSGEPRFVLVFDFFHPDLTAAEIFYLSRLAHQRQLGKPYLADAAAAERVGWAGPAAGSGAEPAG